MPARETRITQYWHPVAAVADVTDQPQRFTLLGRGLVAFRDEQGVAVLNDVCIHRGAALSKGWIENGRLTCAFHGWQYDRAGVCQRIPALPAEAAIPRAARVPAFQVVERYGLVWVALEDPVAPLPAYPYGEDSDAAFTRNELGKLVWQTSAGRAVENSMDISHFPYVHPFILGDPQQPRPPVYEVRPSEQGILYRTEREGYVPEGQQRKAGHTEYHHAFPFCMFLKNDEGDGRSSTVGVFYSPTAAKVTTAWRILYRNYAPRLDREEEIERIMGVLDQDREALESVRPEEIPVSLREELHLKVPDAASIAFRRWIESVDMLDLAPV